MGMEPRTCISELLVDYRHPRSAEPRWTPPDLGMSFNRDRPGRFGMGPPRIIGGCGETLPGRPTPVHTQDMDSAGAESWPLAKATCSANAQCQLNSARRFEGK